jgi:hypothetical protein
MLDVSMSLPLNLSSCAFRPVNTQSSTFHKPLKAFAHTHTYSNAARLQRTMGTADDICEIIQWIDCLCTCAICLSDMEEDKKRRQSDDDKSAMMKVEPVGVAMPSQMYTPAGVHLSEPLPPQPYAPFGGVPFSEPLPPQPYAPFGGVPFSEPLPPQPSATVGGVPFSEPLPPQAYAPVGGAPSSEPLPPRAV